MIYRKAFLLISSNSSNKQKAIEGKSLQPFEDQINEEIKASPLNLQMDIVHLQKYFQSISTNEIKICQTSFSNKLQRRNQILEQIKKFFYVDTSLLMDFYIFYFWFSGHGFSNGDLCIETKQCPDGQKLEIQKILQICQNELKNLIGIQVYINIDSCYSGKNIVRAQQFLKKNKLQMNINIQSSSGPNRTSINTSLGGLLVAKWCKNTVKQIKQKNEELKKKFQARGPIRLIYWASEKQQCKYFIKQSKFSQF